MSAVDRERLAAVRTLKALGYTYHGGEQWKPPLGQSPDERNEMLHWLDHTDALLRWAACHAPKDLYYRGALAMWAVAHRIAGSKDGEKRCVDDLNAHIAKST